MGGYYNSGKLRDWIYSYYSLEEIKCSEANLSEVLLSFRK